MRGRQIEERPVKVLTFFNDYLQMGGERQSVQLIAEGLRNVGVTHELVVVTNEGLLGQGRLHAASKLARNRDLEQLIIRKISDFQPQLVHVENTFPSLGSALFRVLSQLDTPWVQTIRNYRSSCVAASHFRAGKNCVDCLGPMSSVPALVHRCYRRSVTATVGGLAVREIIRRQSALNPPSATILTSQFLRDFYAQSGRAFPRPVVIGNPIKFDVQKSIKTVSDRRWDFAFVGRLEAEKGLDIFLEIATRMPENSFVVVGSGTLAAEVGRAARDLSNLSYLHELSTSEVTNVFGESRWALIPSRWNEPFGRVAIEALGRGCVPIVSGHGGLAEIVEDLGFPELVVKSLAIESWLKALRKVMLVGPGDEMQNRQYLWEAVHTRFGLKNVGLMHKKIYSEVLMRG